MSGLEKERAFGDHVNNMGKEFRRNEGNRVVCGVETGGYLREQLRGWQPAQANRRLAADSGTLLVLAQ